jgi:hypothetical protein
MSHFGKNYWKYLIECNFDIKLTLSFKGLSTNYKKIEKHKFFVEHYFLLSSMLELM